MRPLGKCAVTKDSGTPYRQKASSEYFRDERISGDVRQLADHVEGKVNLRIAAIWRRQ